MSKPARSCGSRVGVRRCYPLLVVCGAALLLAGCSSAVSRFDYPVFGYGPAEGETTGAISPNEPVYGDPGRGSSYRLSQSDNYSQSAPVPPVTRSDDPYVRQRTQSYQQPYQPTRRVAAVNSRPAPRTSTVSRPSSVEGAVVVGPGDTLYSLSRRHHVSVDALKRANNISGNSIQSGQRLVIPGSGPQSAGSHTVRAGETIYSISRQYGVSHQDVARVNNLSDPNQIKLGQVLTLPPGAGTTAGVGNRMASRGDTTNVRKVRTHKVTPPKKAVAKKKAVKPKKRVAKLSDPAPRSQGRFRWPVRGRIISKFGPKANGAHNDGINVAVPIGTSVKAVENGVVAYAGNELKGYGNLVLIRHADNWVSAYAHNEKLLVKRGDKVTRGQIVAKAGKSGSVSQPQLHFELRKGSKPVNPLKHMAAL